MYEWFNPIIKNTFSSSAKCDGNAIAANGAQYFIYISIIFAQLHFKCNYLCQNHSGSPPGSYSLFARVIFSFLFQYTYGGHRLQKMLFIHHKALTRYVLSGPLLNPNATIRLWYHRLNNSTITWTIALISLHLVQKSSIRKKFYVLPLWNQIHEIYHYTFVLTWIGPLGVLQK